MIGGAKVEKSYFKDWTGLKKGVIWHFRKSNRIAKICLRIEYDSDFPDEETIDGCFKVLEGKRQ